MIYLVRHGETEWNRLRLLQGHTDIPLSEDGAEQIRSQGLRGFRGILRIQVHGDLPQKHCILAKSVHFKAQFRQKIGICQQFGCAFRTQPHRQGRQQHLGGDGLLIGFQLFKKDPLVGGVLVN